jgi:hypothetical protein
MYYTFTVYSQLVIAKGTHNNLDQRDIFGHHQLGKSGLGERES